MAGYLPPLMSPETIGDHKHIDAAGGNIVIGHNQADADAPDLGKVANMRIKNGILYADFVGINKAGLEVIKQFSYYSPDMMTDPPELLGVSLLGQTPPHFKFPPLTDYEPRSTTSGLYKYENIPIFEETIRKPNENSKESFSFDNKWIHKVKNQFDLDKEKSIKSRFSKLKQENRANFALPLTEKGIDMPDDMTTADNVVGDTNTGVEAVLGQLVTLIEGVGDVLAGLPAQVAAAVKGENSDAQSEAAENLTTEGENNASFSQENETPPKKDVEDETSTKKNDAFVESELFDKAEFKREFKAEFKAENDKIAHDKFIVDSCNKLHAAGKIGNIDDKVAHFRHLDTNDCKKEIEYLEQSQPLGHLKQALSTEPKPDKKAVFSRAVEDLTTNSVALEAYGSAGAIRERYSNLDEKGKAAFLKIIEERS